MTSTLCSWVYEMAVTTWFSQLYTASTKLCCRQVFTQEGPREKDMMNFEVSISPIKLNLTVMPSSLSVS